MAPTPPANAVQSRDSALRLLTEGFFPASGSKTTSVVSPKETLPKKYDQYLNTPLTGLRGVETRRLKGKETELQRYRGAVRQSRAAYDKALTEWTALSKERHVLKKQLGPQADPKHPKLASLTEKMTRLETQMRATKGMIRTFRRQIASLETTQRALSLRTSDGCRKALAETKDRLSGMEERWKSTKPKLERELKESERELRSAQQELDLAQKYKTGREGEVSRKIKILAERVVFQKEKLEEAEKTYSASHKKLEEVVSRLERLEENLKKREKKIEVVLAPKREENDPPATGSVRVTLAPHMHLQSHPDPVHGIKAESTTQAEMRGRYPVDYIIEAGHFKATPQREVVGPQKGKAGVIPGEESNARFASLPKFIKEVPYSNPHIGFWGVTREEATQFGITSQQPISTVAGKVLKADGLTVYHHPEYPAIDFMSSEKALDFTLSLREARAVQAVEVMNPLIKNGNPSNVLAWTERNFFNRGLFPAVVSGLDDHGKTELAKEPVFTVAVSASKKEHDLMTAVRHGRTYITKDPKLAAEVSIDGRYGLGSRPTLVKGTTHQMRASFDHLPPGATVQVVKNGEVIRSAQAVNGKFDQTIPITISEKDSETHTGYTYVRVLDSNGNLFALTSPIGFKVSDAEELLVSLPPRELKL